MKVYRVWDRKEGRKKKEREKERERERKMGEEEEEKVREAREDDRCMLLRALRARLSRLDLMGISSRERRDLRIAHLG